jgi:hypothetical protein
LARGKKYRELDVTELQTAGGGICNGRRSLDLPWVCRRFWLEMLQ